MIFGEQAGGGHSGEEVLQLYVSRVKNYTAKNGMLAQIFNTNTTKYNKEKYVCLNPPGSAVISDKMFKSGQVISAAHIPPFMLISNIPFEHKAVSTKRSNLSPAPDDLKAD